MSENALDLGPLTAQSSEQPLMNLDPEPAQPAPSTSTSTPKLPAFDQSFEQASTKSDLESSPPTIKLFDFDLDSRPPQSFKQSPTELDPESTPLTIPPDSLKWLNGRGFYENGNPVYTLPGDEFEVNRQSLQHYQLRFVFKANQMAPVRERLERGGACVLDAGCGTGIWSVEMSRDYPTSEFIGTDIVSSFTNLQKEAPQNCQFQIADTMDLPFPDGKFDYVFQRFAWTCYRHYEWPKVISELVRVTKPGGWVELVDASPQVENRGPLTNEFTSKVRQLLELRDVDFNFTFTLNSLLESAELENVVQNHLPIPIGWGPKEIATPSIRNLEAAWNSIKPHMLLSLGLKDEEYDVMYNGAMAEFVPYKSYWNVICVYGRKPTRESDCA